LYSLFDLRVIIYGTNYTFDREELQVVCEGRKIGFQIDPTIGVDVEGIMGKIGADSKSNIFDVNGNAMEDNIKLNKAFAGINLDEASSSFTFTLENVVCSVDGVGTFTDEIKSKIMLLLGLETSDTNRIVLTSLQCENGNTVITTTTLLPPSTDGGGALRTASLLSSTGGINTQHSISLFKKLHDLSQEKPRGENLLSTLEGRRVFAEEKDSNNNRIGFFFHVSDLKIIPSVLDTKAMLTTESDKLDEEEELYQFASSRKVGDQPKEMIMKKTDRRAIVHEIEMHEDALIGGMQQNFELELKEGRQHEEQIMREMKTLHIELLVVTLVCIGISFAALLYLKK